MSNDLRYAFRPLLKNPGLTDERQSRSQRKGNAMKIRIPSLSVTAFLLACCTYSLSSQTLTPDLKAVPDGKGWKGNTGATRLIEKDGAAAIEINKPGQNVVWLDGFH